MISTVSARRLAFLVLLTFAPLLAHATIGDDLTKLRAEYGPAKEVGGEMLFRHDGYSITVAFDGTRAGMEIFLRDGSVPSKPDMTDQDVQSILAAEGGGQAWNPVSTPSGQPMWVRADNKIIARYNPGEKIMTVMVNAR